MKKYVNARSKALVDACLQQDKNKKNEDIKDNKELLINTDKGTNTEENDSDSSNNDIIEGSPQAKSMPLKSACVVGGKKMHGQLLHDESLVHDKIPYSPTTVSCDQESIAEKSIEAPPYSPITPKQTVSLKFNNQESIAEKSIEAPPYSPITPKQTVSFNNQESIAEKSVDLLKKQENIENSKEALPHSPITSGLLISPSTIVFSPMPRMSPETKALYDVLVNSDDILKSPNQLYNDNSDDSVKDPDFVPINYISEDSTSSEQSISLLRTTAEIRQESQNNTQSSNRMISSTNNFRSVDNDHNDEENRELDRIDVVSTSVISPTTENEINPDNDHLLPLQTIETNSNNEGRPKKGRKRKYDGHSRQERKKRKYLNLPFINSRKKKVEAKTFIDVKKCCIKKCYNLIIADLRMQEFDKFYSLGSYDAQNMYIVACVKETPVARHYVPQDKGPINKSKEFTRIYSLNRQPVCRKLFLETLGLSSKRINTALTKMRSVSLKDRRGLKGGHNKAPTISEELFIKVVNKLPSYTSHYRRPSYNDARFLRSEMTFSKIYDLYVEEAKSASVTPLAKSTANKVFFAKFNLRTKEIKKDTCNKCDYYASQKTILTDEDSLTQLENIQTSHLNKAKTLQDKLKSDMKLAKEDPTVETMTFDLQKTLPLPRIPTNLVFYLRQLWVYNLGIHTGKNDQGNCYVWVEGEAGRGSQEVASCIIKHISENLSDDIEKLFLWCDSCGGQNRNIKLTLMLKALLNDHPKLQQITIRFLESGHSFLPNDNDFAKIECALKHQQRLYTPEDYMDIMKTCKKVRPLIVHRMRQEDFFSCEDLEKNTTNRKKTVDGSKISWLNTKEITLKKVNMHAIYMRPDLESEYSEVNLKKRGKDIPMLSQRLLKPLWPTGKPVAEAKLKDLKTILHLIPKDAQHFYKNITGDPNIEDDIDGFNGTLDFEIDREDEDQS